MAETHAQKLSKAERYAKVLDLRGRGLTYQQIADQKIPGVGSRQQACRIVKKELAKLPTHNAEQLRAIENERYDVVQRRMFTIMGNKATSDGDAIRAAGTLVRLFGQRATLNGLNLQPSGDLSSGVQTVLVDMSVVAKTLSEPDYEVGEDPEDPADG